MSNVHVIHIEDANGDLVDIESYHHGCAPANALGWPAPEAVDYPVYCDECGERIEAIPLTDYGRAEYDEDPAP
jgi:hypothetical protein